MATQPQQEQHWRDRFIAKSEVISDTFEVAKAYGARIAEWVLYGCLFANILEMFPIPFPGWFGNAVLAVQAITLDIAGFGLTTMGDHARRQGNEKAARTAQRMGWTLIGLMILTVGLVTLSILIPQTKPFVDGTEKGLILLRVVVTVLYGHIVHSLRQASVDYTNHMIALQQEVSSLRQTVSTLQPQLDTATQQVDTLTGRLREKTQAVDTLAGHLNTEQHKVSTLQQNLETEQGEGMRLRQQVHTIQIEVETLQAQREAKRKEVESLRESLMSGQQMQESYLRHLLEVEQQHAASLQQQLVNEQDEATTLRRHLNAALVDDEELRTQLEAKQQEIESKHIALTSEQQTVATLRIQLEAEQRRVSSLRQKLESGQATKVSTGQEQGVGSGQGKVVQLDASRRKGGQGEVSEQAIGEQIRALLAAEPGLSGRAIAVRLSCSPTTASRWKSVFERGQDEPSEQFVVGGE